MKSPPELEVKRSRKIKPQDINKLEELWKLKPQAQVADLNAQKQVQEEQMQPVLLRYKDPRQYKNVFDPLIKLEADYDKSFKESQT